MPNPCCLFSPTPKSLFLTGEPRKIQYRQQKINGLEVLLQSTGLRTGGTVGKELYEGDIISFAIKGAPHGREREECKAAHIWWCQENGCWAFGRWNQKIGPINGGTEFFRTWNWWYTMQDDIDCSSITLLGNIFESPELVTLLGYTPQL